MKSVVKQLVLHHMFQLQNNRIDAKSCEAANLNFDQTYIVIDLSGINFKVM